MYLLIVPSIINRLYQRRQRTYVIRVPKNCGDCWVDTAAACALLYLARQSANCRTATYCCAAVELVAALAGGGTPQIEFYEHVILSTAVNFAFATAAGNIYMRTSLS